MPSRALTLVTDLGVVVAFAAVGRASHAEGLSVPGVLAVAWPFAAGLAAGWAVVTSPAVGPLRPQDLVDGVVVWASTVGVGMSLRALTGSGTALSFVIVATTVLGAGLIGSRLVGRVIDARR